MGLPSDKIRTIDSSKLVRRQTRLNLIFNTLMICEFVGCDEVCLIYNMSL